MSRCSALIIFFTSDYNDEVMVAYFEDMSDGEKEA